MGIEELKLVLQTLSGLGEAAKDGFIWWLVVAEVLPRALFLLGLSAVLVAIWKIVRMILDFYAMESSSEKAVKDIAGIVGVYVDYPYPLPGRLKEVVEEVRKLKEGKQ